MNNDLFFDQFANTFANANLPAAILDSDFLLLWRSEAALAFYPCLAEPDGAQVLLRGYDPVKIKAEIAEHGKFSTDTAGNLFADRALTICVLDAEKETHYLLQPSVLPRLGTGTNPEGLSRTLSIFDGQCRSQLGNIFSSLGHLQHPSSEEERDLYLQVINQSSFQMLRTFEWIYGYTCLSNGIAPLRLARVDLYSHLRQLLGAAKEKIEAHGISFSIRIPLGSLDMVCDADKLSDALLNIIANSCRFTRPDNRITVRVRPRAHGVSISIADRGIGIPAAILPRVFEPYFSYGENLPPFAGTGLGLPIAKEAVEAMGGILTLSSVENEGTTVLFTLPVTENESTPPTLESTAADYLNDRFSPLHVALADTIPCEL